MDKQAYWDGYKQIIFEQAAGDEEKVLDLIREGFAPELANVSSVQYAKELVAAWCEILEEFGGHEG